MTIATLTTGLQRSTIDLIRGVQNLFGVGFTMRTSVEHRYSPTIVNDSSDAIELVDAAKDG